MLKPQLVIRRCRHFLRTTLVALALCLSVLGLIADLIQQDHADEQPLSMCPTEIDAEIVDKYGNR